MRIQEKVSEETKTGTKLKIAIFLTAVMALLAVPTTQAISPLLKQITSTSGIVSNVQLGVYQDRRCTQLLPSIDWGYIVPGENVTYTVYLCNLGNVDLIVQMETENWNPLPASNYIVLSWDFTEQAIEPNDIVQVTFTLAVSSDIIDVQSFNFDIALTCQAS